MAENSVILTVQANPGPFIKTMREVERGFEIKARINELSITAPLGRIRGRIDQINSCLDAAN
jgi:hypothetical protein